MPSSILRQTARAMSEVAKDPEVPAIRRIEAARMVVALMGKKVSEAESDPPASEEKDSVFGGLDEN